MIDKLVRETPWSRIVRSKSGGLLSISKFLDDRFSVTSQEIIASWKTMSSAEQLDFLVAFLARPKINEEDKEIIDFLMEAGSEEVHIMIAPLMPKYPIRDRALRFLITMAETYSEGVANCYQALQAISDTRAVPVIRMRFSGYKERFLLAGTKMGTIALVDYVYACAALRSLAPEDEYDDVLRELANVSDERAAHQANRILRG